MNRTLLSSKGQGLIQVMMAMALMGAIAVGGMQLMSGLSKSSSAFSKKADAGQLELTMTNLLTSPDACGKVFVNIIKDGQHEVKATNIDQKITKSKIGTLIIGNMNINSGDKYGDLTIADYYIENLKLSPDFEQTAFGDLVLKASFMANAKTKMEKEIRVPAIKFKTESGSDILTECSSSGVTGDDVCALFDATLGTDGLCTSNTLNGTTSNSGTITGGTVTSTTISQSTLSSSNTFNFNGTISNGAGTITNVTLNGVQLVQKCVSIDATESDVYKYQDVHVETNAGGNDYDGVETFETDTCPNGDLAEGECEVDLDSSSDKYKNTTAGDCEVEISKYLSDTKQWQCKVRNTYNTLVHTNDDTHFCRFKATLKCGTTICYLSFP